MSERSLQNPFDLSATIVAESTAAGRGALAIVRVAGPRAHTIARASLSRWPARARTATLATVRDTNGMSLDQSVVIRYDAPSSFTGDDSVELITHGGPVVATTIVAAFVARGARLALPGEFTRRALLNGKLDILQAEATADLIGADSRAAQRVALRQLDGGLSRRVLALRDRLIGLEALIAYDIDFPEEDDGPIAPARIRTETDALIVALEQLLATSNVGTLVRTGALVVLAGAPNVGKSSLFNALVGESRAIVTNIPGTTRDAIEAVIDTPALPLRLADTAGLRDADDPVERLGVEVSESYVARAAIVLACADSRASAESVAASLAGRALVPVIAVRTKADLHSGATLEFDSLRELIGARDIIAVSAETGEGLSALIASITRIVLADAAPLESDAPVLTQERHRYAVSQALEETRAFYQAWHDDMLPPPVAAVHLRTAVTALEDLIGSVDVDDVLDEVFRRFCVGK